jgi:hypothetical protein
MKKPRTIRRKNAHPEHDSQVALFQWAKLMEPRYPELALMFAVPNGMRTSMRTAIKAKAEGLKAGVPDVWLPVPNRAPFKDGYLYLYTGLVIEMKAPKGRASDAQHWWLEELTDQGWRCEVCYSATEAIAAVCEYLNIPQEERPK